MLSPTNSPDLASRTSTGRSTAQHDGAPTPSLASPARLRLAEGNGWHRISVFYEVMVRSFADSDGDGVGDLAGLRSRLDYLAWLGVDCLWLPPFYPSPLRDGGYDVADFTDVDPTVGTIADFSALVEDAHNLGIKVIVDFVLNHTSDAHPWFQASRAEPEGPFGDFYMWADNDTGYAGAPIIFSDTEVSNWTWDPVRGQYFWHRF